MGLKKINFQDLFRRLLGLIRQRLFAVISSFLFAWCFHTFLLVVKNEGFGGGTPLGRWINTYGNTSSSMIIWGLISGLLWSFIYSAFKFGPVQTVTNYSRAPVYMYKMMTGQGKIGYALLAVSAGLSLFISCKVRFTQPANFCLGLVWTFFGLSQFGHNLARYVLIGWIKLMNFLSQHPQIKFKLEIDPRLAQLMVVGLSPGFLMASLFSPALAFWLGIILLAAGIFYFYKHQTPKPALSQISSLFIVGVIGSLVYLFLETFLKQRAFADDGGWQEGGGNLKSYVKSQGAVIAVGRGVGPAAASAGGALFPPINPMDPSTIPPGTEMGGKVWFDPPGNIGGPYWMDKGKYLEVKKMLDGGYVYTKDFGWQPPDRVQELRDKARDSKEIIDKARRERDEKERLADLEWQKAADEREKFEREKTERLFAMRARQRDLEKASSKANRSASYASPTVLMDGITSTAREVVTGQAADGKTSYKGLALRGLVGVLTGGASETYFIGGGTLYRTKDGLARGDSIGIAVGGALVGAAKEKLLAGAFGVAAKAAGTAVKAVGTGIGNIAGKIGTKLGSLPPLKVPVISKVPSLAGRASKLTDAVKLPPVQLPKKILNKQNALERALSITDPTKRTNAIKGLYKKGGIKELDQLQRLGKVSAKQAGSCNDVITKTVNDSVDKGVRRAIKDVQKANGVRIKEVLVGDSGSSAKRIGTGRSVNTDADRTALVSFNKGDLKRYADKYHGGDTDKAHDALSKKFVAAQDKQVARQLKRHGLSADDVEYKTYDRFGKTTSAADNYPSGYVRATQATQGSTRVYKVDKVGNPKRPYTTSGQAMTDQDAMLSRNLTGDPSLLKTGPRIGSSDAKALLSQQAQAMGKADIGADKAAKALLRIDKAASLSGAPRPDPKLVQQAKYLRERPQDALKGMGPDAQANFVNDTRNAVNGLKDKI